MFSSTHIHAKVQLPIERFTTSALRAFVDARYGSSPDHVRSRNVQKLGPVVHCFSVYIHICTCVYVNGCVYIYVCMHTQTCQRHVWGFWWKITRSCAAYRFKF